MSMIYRDVIIIGGGASGIICAIKTAENNRNAKITIIEKQSKIGRKLMSTGNGRCNLTNRDLNIDKYHGSFKDNVDIVLEKYSAVKLIEEFKNYGLLTRTDIDGRVYPHSNHASTVLEVLLAKIQQYNIQIDCNVNVNSITKSNDCFTIKTNNSTYICDKLVISTGSKASPKLGSDTSGIKLLEKLDHKATELSPALCSIPVESKVIKSLKGIRATGKVALYDQNNIVYEEIGEIQFTETSLSGVCIFNLSSYLKGCNSPKIAISLLPDLSYNEILCILENKIKNCHRDSNVENIFTGIFQCKLSIAILKECNLYSSTKKISELSNKDIKTLANFVNNWNFKFIDNLSFDKAQVVAGGIKGNEINPYTMESKLVDNLYICGEAIDINGDCGGYNLHFAFASGLIAGENL